LDAGLEKGDSPSYPHFLEKPDEPGWFRQNKMKVGLPTFMLTADEPTTVQKYAMKIFFDLQSITLGSKG